ncbi:MAG TPA: DUF2240 family protein [Methanomicrobiales archaeon]|nr:DUF2240 family protein [Methanomicrobiales archaeon]
MSLAVTVAAPFKHTRKDRLQKSEFIFYLTIDRKWMSRDQANQVLDRAKDAGMVEVADGWVRPLLDLSSVTVPVGFRPDSRIFESEEASQVLIGRIATARGVPPAEVVAEVNRVIREGFDGNLRLPAAAVIVARRHGIGFTDLLDRLMVEVLEKKDGK